MHNERAIRLDSSLCYFSQNCIDITQIITNFAVDFIQYYKFHYSLYKEGGLDYKLDLFI